MVRSDRSRHVRRAFAIVSALALIVAGVQLIAVAPASAATKPVTITFTQIVQYGTDVDPGITQGPVGDFYAGASINGGPKQSTFANKFNYGFEFGVGYIFPWSLTPPASWSITADVDDTLTTVPVAIELWDNDDCDDPFCDDTGIFENDDDQVDISPTSSETVNIDVNLADGTWSGDVSSPQNCARGNFGGGEESELCWDISTISASGDADGDRLLDGWEQHGVNGDGDSTIDVDLPAFGANPNRKDLFVELDCLVNDGNSDGDLVDAVDHSHCPTAAQMRPVVQSFANAPVNNPDGTTGIQLHLDVGSLFPAVSVNGTGGVTGNIGNFGGGGSQIPEAGNTVIDYDGAAGSPGTSLYALKNANFDRAKRQDVFRYAIFGHQTNARAAVNDCTSGQAEDIPGNDFYVTLGGSRDLDGNGVTDTPCWTATASDTIDNDGDGRVDEDPQDGADNDGDCVPGTDTDGDGTACDPGDVGVNEDGGISVGSNVEVSGTFMHEFGHVLGLQHGGGESTNNNKPNYLSVMNYSFQSCSVPTSPAGAAFPLPGGCDFSRADVDLDENSLDECFGVGPQFGLGIVNWNGNGANEGTTCPAPNTTNIGADINNNSSRTALPGFDDWAAMFFDFRGLDNFGDDGSIHPVTNEPDPQTIEDSRNELSRLTRPDVQVTMTGPATALPGQALSYGVHVANTGRGPALQTSLVAARPDGTTSTTPLDAILVGSAKDASVSYVVPADACPQTLTTSATASYIDMASLPGSATGSASTQVLDVTPPKLTVSLSPASLWPPNHKMKDITATIVATDECDPHPQVRLLSVTSNEPDNGLGDGDTANDIAGAAAGADDRSFQLRAERSGKGNGRTYTATYEARDISGNAIVRTATVTVAH